MMASPGFPEINKRLAKRRELDGESVRRTLRAVPPTAQTSKPPPPLHSTPPPRGKPTFPLLGTQYVVDYSGTPRGDQGNQACTPMPRYLCKALRWSGLETLWYVVPLPNTVHGKA